MSFINLTKYISQGGILRNLALSGQFDCIIYEEFTKEGFEIPEGITVRTFSELGFEHGVSGLLAGVENDYKNILLILDQTHRSECIPYLEMHSGSEQVTLHVVLLHTGISGLLSGIGIRNTIGGARIHTPCSIHEPFDIPSFFSGLAGSGIHLHMIHDGDYISNLFTGNEEARSQESLHNMTGFGFSGHHGTVVCSGRIVAEVVGALQVVQEQETFYDLFVSQSAFPIINDEIKESIMKTEKLIVISDQSLQVLYSMITTLLATAGMSDISLEIITPKTETVTTTQWEYLYEQAQFGKEALVEKLG